MQAGRELDALVAERVMGWTIKFMGKTYWGFPPVDKPTAFAGELPVPSYSTSIAAAWEVVEKLRAQGHHTILWPHDEGWALTILNAFTSGEDLVATAPTAPLAICLGALKAIEP